MKIINITERIISSMGPGAPKNPIIAGIAFVAYFGVVSLVGGLFSLFTAASMSSSIPWIPFLNSTILRPIERMADGSRLPNKSRAIPAIISNSKWPGMPKNAIG